MVRSVLHTVPASSTTSGHHTDRGLGFGMGSRGSPGTYPRQDAQEGGQGQGVRTPGSISTPHTSHRATGWLQWCNWPHRIRTAWAKIPLNDSSGRARRMSRNMRAIGVETYAWKSGIVPPSSVAPPSSPGSWPGETLHRSTGPATTVQVKDGIGAHRGQRRTQKGGHETRHSAHRAKIRRWRTARFR